MLKTRLEADEVAAQLERCDKENKILKDEMNKEIEAVLLPFLAFFLHPTLSIRLSHLPSIFPGVDNKDEQSSLLLGWPSLHSLISSRLCFFISFSLLVFFILQLS